MIRTIIVENEKQHSDYLLAMFSRHFPEVEVIALCESVPDGISKIKALQPELVFLDVELPPYTGFDLLERVGKQNYEVIFTTAFNKYAVKALKFCALDFIEKPFSLEDLKEALDRYKNKVATDSSKHIDALLHNIRSIDKMSEVVGIPVLGGFDFIQVGDIIRAQASDNCTDFYLTEKRKVTATKTLKWVDDLLTDHFFARVHDSHLVNLNHIKSYRKGNEGGVVLLTDQQEVDVSRRRKDDFLKALAERKIISLK